MSRARNKSTARKKPQGTQKRKTPTNPRENPTSRSTRRSVLTARNFFGRTGYTGRKAGRKPNELERTGMVFRAAARLEPASSIQETEDGGLSFTACIATDAPVEMEAYVGGRWIRFLEILDRDGLNLEREDCIGMFLDHQMWNTRNVAGRWSNFRWVKEGGVNKLLADGYISSSDDMKDIRTKVKDGSIQTFSLGYSVEDYFDETPDFAEEGESELPILRAIAYTAIEASLTAAPADHRAVMRAAIVYQGGTDMAGRRKKNTAPARSKQQSNTPKQTSQRGNRSTEDEDEFLDEGFEDEQDELFLDEEDEQDDDQAEDEDEHDDTSSRSRSTRSRRPSRRPEDNPATSDLQLVRACRNAQIPVNFLGRYANRDEAPTVDEMLSDFARSRSRRSPDQPVQQDFTPDAPTGRFRAIVSNAVRTFSGRNVEFDEEAGRDLPQMTPAELLRQICRSHNIRYPESSTDYYEFLRRDVPPSVGDAFAKVLEEVSNVLIVGPTEGEKPLWFEAISARVSAPSYAAMVGRSKAEWDALTEHAPGEEVEAGTPTVFDVNARLRPFNKRFVIPRTFFETLGEEVYDSANGINRAARKGFRKHVNKKLMMNPVMSDGIRFFHASRGNVGENMPLGITNISIARIAMRGDDTDEAPSILVVSQALELEAQQALKDVLVTDRSDVRPDWAGKLEIVVAPSLPADAWMLMHDVDEVAAFLDVRRSGQTSAIIEVERSFQYDGIVMLGRADFEFANNNPRGAYLAWTGDAPATLNIEGVSNNYPTEYGI